MLPDIERAAAALQAISPDLPRDDWIKAGMAAHAAGLDFDKFDAWSAQGSNYDAAKCRSEWRTFKAGKGIGPGTLFRMAAEHGHLTKAPSPHPQPAPRPASVPAPASAAATSRPSAAELWARFEPASPDHAYVRAKDAQAAPLEGLRVVPAGDPLRILGEPMAGALVLPVRRATGELLSLQFVTPPETAERLKARGKSSKPNLPGASLEDGFYVVGELQPGGPVQVCEGIGAAWACWRATGHPAVVAFGSGRMRAVARALRQHDPQARLLLVPDAGKETDAALIATEVGGEFVNMPEGWPSNSDVADLAQREGLDVLEALLHQQQKPAMRYRLLRSADLAKLPPLQWLVRGLLPRQGLAAIFGPSGSGKSFLALDLLAAVAEGRPWFGHRTRAAPVVYCALEGEGGIRARVHAWELHHQRPLPDGMRIVLQPVGLTEAADVDELAAAVPHGAVIVLDTLNRAAPGLDENASADMGRILAAAKRLQALTEGLVILIHHTGKDASKGLRGHSSLHAALDAALETVRSGDQREWRCAKSKDGADDAGALFSLRVITLGTDEFGEPSTSCVAVPDTAPAIARVKLPAGGNQKLVLEALRPLFKTGETGKPGAPPTRPCITLEQAVTAGAASLTSASDKRTTRAREALTGLVGRGILGLNEGWLWLV